MNAKELKNNRIGSIQEDYENLSKAFLQRPFIKTLEFKHITEYDDGDIDQILYGISINGKILPFEYYGYLEQFEDEDIQIFKEIGFTDLGDIEDFLSDIIRFVWDYDPNTEEHYEFTRKDFNLL